MPSGVSSRCAIPEMQALIFVAYGAFLCQGSGKNVCNLARLSTGNLEITGMASAWRLEGSIAPCFYTYHQVTNAWPSELQTPENFAWGCLPPSQAATLRYQTRFLQ